MKKNFMHYFAKKTLQVSAIATLLISITGISFASNTTIIIEDNKIDGVVQNNGLVVLNSIHGSFYQDAEYNSWSLQGAGYISKNLKVKATNRDIGFAVGAWTGNPFTPYNLTVDSLEVSSTSKDHEAIIHIFQGSTLTSIWGTVLKNYSLLELGNADSNIGVAEHKGDITLQSTQTSFFEDLPGFKHYGAAVSVASGNPSTPHRIDGDLNILHGTLFMSNDYKDVAPELAAPAFLKVTGNTNFSSESSWGIYEAADNMLRGNGSTSTLTVADGSQLYVARAANGTYSIISDFATVDNANGAAWTGSNLASVPMYKVTGTWQGNKYILTVSATDIKNIAPGISESKSVLFNEFYAQGANNPATKAFVDTVLEALPENERAAVLEGITSFSSASGALSTILAIATENVSGRVSGSGTSTVSQVALYRDENNEVKFEGNLFAGPVSGNLPTTTPKYNNGFAIWFAPQYQYSAVSGLKIGNFQTGSKSHLGGIILGSDYTFKNMFRLGLAFNTGLGYTKSTGDFSPSGTHTNYWGLSLYSGLNYNNFTLSADLGYSASNSEVTQQNPAILALAHNIAKIKGNALSLGLKAEYSFATQFGDITPYAGVRYNHMTTKGYDITNNNAVLFTVDKANQDLWIFPVGVNFLKVYTTSSNWNITPQVALGALIAAGDVKALSRTRIPGLDNYYAESTMRVVDTVTFDAKIGVDLQKNNFTLGFNYNPQISQHGNSHNFTAKVKFSF